MILVRPAMPRSTKATGDQAAFRASLEIRSEIARATADDLDRVHELVTSTNQFNTTTRRYTKAELHELISDTFLSRIIEQLSGRHRRLVAKYIPTDRYGPARNLLPSHGFTPADSHAWELALS